MSLFSLQNLLARANGQPALPADRGRFDAATGTRLTLA
jgi:hypothetical protein